MTGRGHILAGLALSIGSFKFGHELSNSTFLGSLVAIGTILGSTAPDYLEIRRKVYRDGQCVGTRTLIPHRTITHTVSLWVGLLYLAYCLAVGDNKVSDYIYSYINLGDYIPYFFIGYALGGILHLLVDLPNLQPIPILTPWDKFSLKLWRSGKMEPLIVTVILFGSLVYCDIVNVNLGNLGVN